MLDLDADNQLRITPVPELGKLRRAYGHFDSDLITTTGAVGTAPIIGEQIEIKATFQMEQAESFGFKFIDDESECQLSFDCQSHILKMGDQRAHLQFTRTTDRIETHILVDHSIIEIFINEREAFTIAFYPKLAEHHELKIFPFITNGQGRFKIDVWKLDAAQIIESF